MKLGAIFLFLTILIACKTNEEVVTYGINDQMPICNVRSEPKMKIIRAVNIYEGALLIENADTTAIDNYTFYLVNDTLSLVHAFESVTIPEILKETYTQGRTFLQTTLRSDSTFSPTTILRGIGPNYQPVQNQIDRILTNFRVAELPKDSLVLIFQHQIRIDEF